MSAVSWFKEAISDYFQHFHLSRRSKITLAVLAGVSLSILAAGYLLRQRRRKYRPVAPRTTARAGLYRNNTFKEDHHRQTEVEHMLGGSSLSPGAESTLSERVSELVPGDLSLNTDWQREEEEERGNDTDFDGRSVSSDDSFHSTVESIEDSQIQVLPVDPHALYFTALKVASTGMVKCRTLRTKMLHCESDEDFLAKVHCVRLAFDFLIRSPDHRTYFVSISRDVLSDFLRGAGEDPTSFCECFDDIVSFMEREENLAIADSELMKRRVGAMNVYDIALDFVLLDAFDDLENPPSAFVSVLKNTWITNGMKKSALSAALWSILKAKKSILRHKNGFMSRFYVLSETITPPLAWGFLGTDAELNRKCVEFKSVVMKFVRSIFSLDCVRYTSVEMLSEDVLKLAQETAQTMHHFNNSVTDYT